MPKAPVNPIRRYKDREGITYTVLAERLGISEHYARKIGVDLARSVSPSLARQFEERSGGKIRYLDVMRWVGAAVDAA